MLDSFTQVSVTRYSLSSSVLSGAIVEIEHHHFLRQIERENKQKRKRVDTRATNFGSMGSSFSSYNFI